MTQAAIFKSFFNASKGTSSPLRRSSQDFTEPRTPTTSKVGIQFRQLRKHNSDWYFQRHLQCLQTDFIPENEEHHLQDTAPSKDGTTYSLLQKWDSGCHLAPHTSCLEESREGQPCRSKELAAHLPVQHTVQGACQLDCCMHHRLDPERKCHQQTTERRVHQH